MSDDEPEDPFESFDAVEDREGDPFERLDDAGPADGGDDAAPAEDSDDESTAASATDTDEPVFEEEFIDEGDPFPIGADTAASPSPAGETTEDAAPGDDPFEGMQDRDGDPFGEGESVFESVDVEDINPDKIWESLDEEPVQSAIEGSRYVEVSKHRFCEQCEHFSSPPSAHCTHGEAEIIEYLDMETVRLLNCPVVAEQRELEREE